MGPTRPEGRSLKFSTTGNFQLALQCRVVRLSLTPLFFVFVSPTKERVRRGPSVSAAEQSQRGGQELQQSSVRGQRCGQSGEGPASQSFCRGW